MDVSDISATPSDIRDVIPNLQDDHMLPALDTGILHEPKSLHHSTICPLLDPEMNSDFEEGNVPLLNIPQISSPLQDPPPTSINLTTRSLIDMELCQIVPPLLLS